MTDATDAKCHFFVSYNQADRAWATWIAWALEEAGYSVIFQDWDFHGSFIEQMHQASLRARRTLVVLSDNYLRSEYARSEAWTALARDPVGREDRVVAIKVGPTGDLGLFIHFAYLDLTTSDKADAERLLLERVRKSLDAAYRPKPATQPHFPGQSATKPPLPAPAAGPTLAVHNLPQANRAFVGRRKELATLRQALQADGTAAITPTQAITGLGGIGKTSLALAYAYAHLTDYGLIRWLRAEESATLAADYAAAAEPLGLPTEVPNQAALIRAVCGRLEACEDWLLIFDNATEPESLTLYLPQAGQGHVLITSRYRGWEQVAVELSLDVLSEADAVTLLLDKNEVDPDERAEAAALAKDLGYLALALTQARDYIKSTGQRLADYRALLAKRRQDLLQRGVPKDYKLPVLLTWGPSLMAAEKQCAEARPLLELLSFFAPDPLPRTMLAAVPEALPEPLGDPLALNDAVAALTRFSLITAAQGTLTVHRLMQAIVRDNLAPDLAATWAECAIRLVAKDWPSHMWVRKGWSAIQAKLPHALAAAQAAATHAPTVSITSYVLDRAATYFQIRKANAEAVSLFEQAVAVGEKTLGPEHSDLATRLNNLALLYHNTGRYAEAEPLFKRAIVIGEKTLGLEHPDLATRLNNLARLYRVTGRYAEAEPLFKRAIAIDEKTFGPEHPDLATPLNNLALLYRDTGRYAEAEPLYQRAIAILDKNLPSDHPNLAIVRENYAKFLDQLGRGKETAAIRQ